MKPCFHSQHARIPRTTPQPKQKAHRTVRTHSRHCLSQALLKHEGRPRSKLSARPAHTHPRRKHPVTGRACHPVPPEQKITFAVSMPLGVSASMPPAPRTKLSSASVILLALLAAPPTTPLTRSFEPSPRCPAPAWERMAMIDRTVTPNVGREGWNSGDWRVVGERALIRERLYIGVRGVQRALVAVGGCKCRGAYAEETNPPLGCVVLRNKGGMC